MKNENFDNELNFINAPQFPGQQLGKKSIEDVRNIIKRQKRLKGFNYVVPIGTSEFNLNLSGTARILLGIAIIGENGNDFTQITSFNFIVNNEIVIDQLDPNLLSYKFCTNEYYFIPRPLSGTDILTLKFSNTGEGNEIVRLVLYYI